MLKEEKHMLTLKLSDLQRELGDIKVRTVTQNEEHDHLEKEFRKL